MRWKLMVAHYLKVAGTEWEYIETSRKTGQQIRKRFPVPMLLDPKDPACWTQTFGGNDDKDGEIIVCYQGQGNSTDIIFVGDPTPDMMPIDDEARALSATFESRWSYKADDSNPDSGGYAQKLVDGFQTAMAEIQTKPQKVEIEGMAEMLSVLTATVQQNGELIAKLTSNPRRA